MHVKTNASSPDNTLGDTDILGIADAISSESSSRVPSPMWSLTTGHSSTTTPSLGHDSEQMAVTNNLDYCSYNETLVHPTVPSFFDVQGSESTSKNDTGLTTETLGDIHTSNEPDLPGSSEESSALVVGDNNRAHFEFLRDLHFLCDPQSMCGPVAMERFNPQLFLLWHEEYRMPHIWGDYATFANTGKISHECALIISNFFTDCRKLALKVSCFKSQATCVASRLMLQHSIR